LILILQVRKLNREAGESPARSRRCDVERVLFIPLEGSSGKVKHVKMRSQKNCL